MADKLFDTADQLLECAADALAADLRPVCKTYQTHGIPVIFQCCECTDEAGADEETEGANGELSIHFRRLFDADASTLDEVRRVRPCRGGVIAAQYRLVLARCRPIINEKGEVPLPEELTAHTEDQLRDAELLWQALSCCGMDIRIDDLSADLSDPGTCSIMFVDLTVQVQIPKIPADPSP
jgi:hypothetical protein